MGCYICLPHLWFPQDLRFGQAFFLRGDLFEEILQHIKLHKDLISTHIVVDLIEFIIKNFFKKFSIRDT